MIRRSQDEQFEWVGVKFSSGRVGQMDKIMIVIQKLGWLTRNYWMIP